MSRKLVLYTWISNFWFPGKKKKKNFFFYMKKKKRKMLYSKIYNHDKPQTFKPLILNPKKFPQPKWSTKYWEKFTILTKTVTLSNDTPAAYPDHMPRLHAQVHLCPAAHGSLPVPSRCLQPVRANHTQVRPRLVRPNRAQSSWITPSRSYPRGSSPQLLTLLPIDLWSKKKKPRATSSYWLFVWAYLTA